MKPKTDSYFKVLFGQIISTINTVGFLVFSNYHNNIMTDKGLSFFDECNAECAHLKKSAPIFLEGTVKCTHMTR